LTTSGDVCANSSPQATPELQAPKLAAQVGRVYREVERRLPMLPTASQLTGQALLSQVKRILSQQPKGKNRLACMLSWLLSLTCWHIVQSLK
jgi:hypothetical protein